MLIIAGICDLFDGFVARKCKRDEEEKAFGIQIDSLVDVISFIVFPIIILLSIGNTKIYDLIIICLYALFGVARLAYFNIATADSEKAIKYYTGLPVTFIATFFPTLYLLKNVMTIEYLNIAFSIVTFITALLYVSKINVKKPSGIGYVVFSLIAIVEIVLYFVLTF